MTPNNNYKLSDSLLVSQLLEPLFYYDIFSYPLTFEEILQFSNVFAKTKYSNSQLESILNGMMTKGYLFKIEGFFMLKEEPKWVEQRKENNKRAESFIRKAKRVTRLMTWFPYVRAVFISGSLSKNVMHKDGDIDYFIVTKPNRLWVCRTFLILFKKIVLFNSHKYFCVNYFVDDEFLEIEEKNRFTATEIATILPLYGKETYDDFWQKNRLIAAYYPNVEQRKSSRILPQKRSLPQRIWEPIFNLRIGDWLDGFFMKRTLRRWNKKFGNMAQEIFEIALKSRRNVSKHHPQLYQQKVIKAFEERVHDFEKKHDITLQITKSEPIQCVVKPNNV